MPADQAAGLRRRRGRQPLPCIRCFFDTADFVHRLARTLHRHGWTPLLADTSGRLFADASLRSLFDWRQQLARGQLHTLPLSYADGWYAPGLRADAAVQTQALQAWNCLVLDANPYEDDLQPIAGTSQTVLIEVGASHAAMARAFAILKTLAHRSGPCGHAVLLGDAAACVRVQAACVRFLGSGFQPAICSLAEADDAFDALAVRMADEETGPTARYTTGNP